MQALPLLLLFLLRLVCHAPPPCPPCAADDAVEERKLAKSVSCGKTFRGRHALRDLDAVRSWLLELGACGRGWAPQSCTAGRVVKRQGASSERT